MELSPLLYSIGLIKDQEMGYTQHLPADPRSWQSRSKVSRYREIFTKLIDAF